MGNVLEKSKDGKWGVGRPERKEAERGLRDTGFLACFCSGSELQAQTTSLEEDSERPDSSI